MTDQPREVEARPDAAPIAADEPMKVLVVNGKVDTSDSESVPQAGPSELPSESVKDLDGVESTIVEMADLPDAPEEHEQFFDLRMIWQGQTFDFRVGSNDMVFDFREKIYSLTRVKPDRQKLIGLIKGKLSAENDAKRFGTLGLTKPNIKFTMVGTPEDQSFKDEQPSPESLLGTFDVSYNQMSRRDGAVAPADDVRNQRKLAEVIKKYPINVMNEPRPGKNLLVLDLDYTLVDTENMLNRTLTPGQCARPGLHDFLTSAYLNYDIAVWSQTHWRYVESKLTELGIIGVERDYKISFIIDKSPMFTVFTKRNKEVQKHEVKPLGYIWARFPQWSAKNTIHIDDLSRNFAMNPAQGLKISAYRSAGTAKSQQDRQLAHLGFYLHSIAGKDFTSLSHTDWQQRAQRLYEEEGGALVALHLLHNSQNGDRNP